MEAGSREKKVQISPIIPESANDGLRLLAKMIVQSLLQQQTESNREPGGAKQVKASPESTP